jgi:HAD superfamily hydrolase (TIGR01484 family)
MSEPILICTDLDGTLLPNGSAPESPSARRRFAQVVARPEVSLAYVTGRHQALVEEAIAEFALPLPEFLIGDVGTTIYDVDAGGWRPWRSWRELLETEWPPGSHARLQGMLEHLEGVELQEDSKQADFKLSYYVEGDWNRKRLLEDIRQRLGRRRPSAQLIFSRDERGVGLLDLVPRSAGKLCAIVFVQKRKGLRPGRTVFAGDSGNDMQVMTSGLPSVLVANASEAVRRESQELAAANGHLEQLHQARGDFLGMNGNYGAGILEGIAHFLPETVVWME